MLAESHPLIRRVLRFFVLPYYYFKLINWEECEATKTQVIKDLLYIFFVLKYFPYNYSLCRLWEKDRSEWRYYYGSIYEPHQRHNLRKVVQKREYEILFEDKYVCYQLCKAENLPLPDQFACVDPKEDYKRQIRFILNNKSANKIIIKPIIGKGGKNIAIAFKENGKTFVIENGGKIFLDEYILRSRSVIQNYICQHKSLSEISPSVNTIRMVVMLTQSNKVLTVGALMRFGVDDLFIDNTSIGGVAVGINIENGVLNEVAFDFNSKTYTKHPTSGFVFKNYRIPYWQEVIDLSEKIQKNFFYYKMLGLDIAITSDGPVLIEINSAHDNVGIEQACGPILADKNILFEFEKYELLINRHQKNILR